MGDMLNATTVPRAVSFGLLIAWISTGCASLLNQLDGPGEVTIYNIALALFLGLLFALLQYKRRNRRFQALKERGKVGPDTAIDGLPWVRPPRSVKETFWLVIGFTLTLRGIIALLAFTGPWPQLVAEWNTWLVPFLLAVLIGVANYVAGKRHRQRE